MKLFTSIHLLVIAALQPAAVTAQNAFAHVIVGNTFNYDVNQWKSDIQLASKYGIDGFALNIGTPFEGNVATQLSYAYTAANQLNTNFRMFISFDYLGGTSGGYVDSLLFPDLPLISIVDGLAATSSKS